MSEAPTTSRANALTIDVEDYYNIFTRDRFTVDGPPTEAVVRNTERILAVLAARGVTATFFILGEVAEAFPALVRRVFEAGHEIGVHGYYHRQFFKLTPEQARDELGRAKGRLEDLTGGRILGHRAPAFSIGPDTQWALDVLAELGFRYDSSIFPIRGRRYGWPGFPPDIHEMTLPSGSKLIEAPLTPVRVLGKPLPACGGGYMRHFPYAYTRWAIGRINRLRPAILYMHPYEMDTSPAGAEFAARLKAAPRGIRRFHWLQLRNRPSVEGKLQRLLSRYSFAPLRKVIETALGRPLD